MPLAPADLVETSQRDRRQKLAAFDARTKQLEADKTAAVKALKDAEKAPDAERKDQIATANKRVEAVTAALKAVAKERETCAKQPLPFDAAYAVAEGKTAGKKKVGNACVQIKGDPERLGKEVPRRFPTVLGGQTLSSGIAGSGRLDLARWVTDPANPLTARVMVNRIWHFHFGRGLVPTRATSGNRAARPATLSCSITWPDVSSTAAGRSRRCTARSCCRGLTSFRAGTTRLTLPATSGTNRCGSSASARRRVDPRRGS